MTGCIIGSFRKYYADILKVIESFEESNHIILSPKYSSISRNEDGFVILESDADGLSHIDIQTMVFHRAFRSDFVYVWNPNGYVGKTTSYEIGRLIERKIPLYYKEYPVDVPIYVPTGSVITVSDLIEYVRINKTLPPYKQDPSIVTRQLRNCIHKGKELW